MAAKTEGLCKVFWSEFIIEDIWLVRWFVKQHIFGLCRPSPEARQVLTNLPWVLTSGSFLIDIQ
jgi:hypothetical protein